MNLLNNESGLFLWQVIPLILLAMAIVFPIWALIDIVKSRFEEANAKLIWVLIVLLMPLVGSLVYFNIGRKQKRRRVFNPFENQ